MVESTVENAVDCFDESGSRDSYLTLTNSAWIFEVKFMLNGRTGSSQNITGKNTTFELEICRGGIQKCLSLQIRKKWRWKLVSYFDW